MSLPTGFSTTKLRSNFIVVPPFPEARFGKEKSLRDLFPSFLHLESCFSQPDQNLTVAKLWRAPARRRPAFEDVHEGEQLRLMCCLSFCIVLRATPVILNFGERASQHAAQSNDQVWIAFGARGDLGFPVLEFSRFCVGILLVLALIPDRRLADDLIRQNESALIMPAGGKRSCETFLGPGSGDILEEQSTTPFSPFSLATV